MAMLRWTYTNELELSEDDAFLIDLMKLANRFQLQLLRERQVEELHTEFFDCTVDGSGVTFAKCITMPHM